MDNQEVTNMEIIMDKVIINKKNPLEMQKITINSLIMNNPNTKQNLNNNLLTLKA